MEENKDNLNNENNLDSMFSSGSMFDENESSMFSSNIENSNETSMFSEDIIEENENKEQIAQTQEIEPIEKPIEEEIEPIEEIKEIEEIKDVEPSEPIEEIQNFISSEELDYSEENNANHLITVRPVKFQEFQKEYVNRSIKKNLDILQDISMHISVEIGRTHSSIREIMNLNEGSIVELDKIAGEQVEIYANNKLVARGEVIVIEDKFGVRVTTTNLPKPDELI